MDLGHAGNPLLALPDGLRDFDYGAFLQGEEADYLVEESSASSHTVMAATTGAATDCDSLVPTATAATTLSPLDDASSSAQGHMQSKQRLERRGHTKSRRGCFNCKRRRIKCQETRPGCGHCVKMGLRCEYPLALQINHQPQHQVPLFSLQDMRFFQNFLLQCFPHHPLGNETIWTHEVPCLSQNHEYLMHAILGLSASELMQNDPSLVTSAMDHRLKAIRSIKKALADVPKVLHTFEEFNALQATCWALMFQSVLLDDGMAEYMTFIRGIVIVAIQMWTKGVKFIFSNFLGNDQLEMLKPHIEVLPLTEKSWTDAAVASLHRMLPLCRMDVELEYHGLIMAMATGLYQSPLQAYTAMTKHYSWWMMLPHDKFQHVIDPSNQVFVLLAAHWIALKQIMATITETEHKLRNKEPVEHDRGIEVGISRWLMYLNRQVRPEYLPYNEWPMWVEAQLARDMGFFGKTPGH